MNAGAGSDNILHDLGFPAVETDNRLLRDNRTYYVSDERMRAFAKLSYAERLQWVEQCSHCVRLAQAAKAKLVAATPKSV